MSNEKKLFLVKACVSASMKSVSYVVYAHLNQLEGEVECAKCLCKVGPVGCCKHVVALFYTVLDYTNLNLKQIPAELTCTQLPQKWSVPSGRSKTLERLSNLKIYCLTKNEIIQEVVERSKDFF